MEDGKGKRLPELGIKKERELVTKSVYQTSTGIIARVFIILTFCR